MSRASVNPAISAATDTPIKHFHWSMRLMSLVSLLTLGLYSYVLRLCQCEARRNAALQAKGQDESEAEATSEAKYRARLALLAFTLDVLISAYFSSVTPALLKQGGLAFNRKTMPRPLFWFFAVTGFVPTATMTITVLGSRRWHERIHHNRAWRIAHAFIALTAYFSWWLACAPVFLVVLLGERRTLSLLRTFTKPD